MTVLEWCLYGALMLAALAICARSMRKGLPTLDDDRKNFMERLHNGERQLVEESKNISAQEQLLLVQAAMEDLLRLSPLCSDHSVRIEGNDVELATPRGVWRASLAMREISLRSSGKTLHGKSRWLLTGPDFSEEHADAGSLMRNLNAYLHDPQIHQREPEHIARRLGGMATVTRKLYGH